MTEINILFTAAGRRVSLIKHFQKTLGDLGIKGNIHVADAGRSAPASFVATNTHRIPRVSAPNYIPHLLELCLDNNIQLLISLIDTDLTLLSQHKENFSAINTRLLVSDEATNLICFDKNNTYNFFTNNDIPTPFVYQEADLNELNSDKFPLLLKPWDGSCSVGVTKITNNEELQFFLKHVNHPMVQDFIEGDEYTCDAYVDFSGVVRCVVPRKRLETRAGEVSKGLTVRDPSIIEAVTNVVNKLPNPIGCITVQCFKTASGEISFIEINPRFGGGAPLSILSGADFPKWILQEMAGLPCDANMENWKDDLAMLRYDDEIIVNGDQIR